jgi:triosephosphate isomerase (TIM)
MAGLEAAREGPKGLWPQGPGSKQHRLTAAGIASKRPSSRGGALICAPLPNSKKGRQRMAALRRSLLAGNWKMNGLTGSIDELDRLMKGLDPDCGVDVMICPPATLLAAFAKTAAGTGVSIGAQDCHPQPAGPYTGDISAEMLRDAGAVAVIVGHSERRIHHGEQNADVRAKALAAQRAALAAIVCVGETQEQRDRGQTGDVIAAQLAGSLPDEASGSSLVVAYEPVWAIGSGVTPRPSDVAEVHRAIRTHLTERFGPQGEKIRILYGGSVKPDNAGELLAVANVDGALVGGASLKAEEFLAIIVAGVKTGRSRVGP